MNIAYKKAYAVIFSAAVVTTVAYSMENELVVEAAPATSVWYQKRSVQLAAASTVAIGIYAVAARMGKVAVPAMLAGLFVAKLAQETNLVDSAPSANNTADNGNTGVAPQPASADQAGIVNQTTEVTESAPVDAPVTPAVNEQGKDILDKIVDGMDRLVAGTAPVVNKFTNDYKDALVQTTSEDFQNHHEILNK